MKAVLTIPEKEISFEFDNITYNQFKMVSTNLDDNLIIVKETIGEPITLITSNMPYNLKSEIVKMIEEYCNQ